MLYQLNKKINNLEPYETVEGTFKTRLDANECAVNLPKNIIEQIKISIDSINFNRYPDPMAKDVVNSFAEYYNIDSKLVTAGNGSDELIFIIESAFLEKGDKMLVATPDFSMYNFYSSICETVCESFIKDDNLNIDVDAMIDKINRENFKLVIFSNPCNPTGQGITAEQAKKLVDSVNALVVLDEAYMDFWNQSLINEVQSHSNLIILRTASKCIGCAAVRLGFAVANEKLSKVVKAVKSPYNVNSISQAIGSIVYKNKEYLLNRQKTIVSNKEKLYNNLVNLSRKCDDFTVYPSCTNFVFIKTTKSKIIFEYLKENSILIRFMGEYIRITSGTCKENDEVVNYINKFMLG